MNNFKINYNNYKNINKFKIYFIIQNNNLYKMNSNI